MTTQRTLKAGEAGAPRLSRDGRTMIVSIPIRLRHRKGRKQIIAISGVPTVAVPRSGPTRIDSTLVKAIVRAHRWRGMLESRLFTTVRDLAQAEKINESYLSRMLRLTLLSPAIIEAILDGTQPPNLELATLLEKIPSHWDEQAALINSA